MSGVYYIDEVRVYVDEEGYVEYGVIEKYGSARRVHPYKKAKTGGWNNYSCMVKLSTLRAGIKRGTYIFS